MKSEGVFDLIAAMEKRTVNIKFINRTFLCLQFAFIGIRGTNWRGDAAIDDFTLSHGPCT